MNPKELDPKESLAIITKMIHQTQFNAKHQAVFFLLWGWLTLIAAIGHYLLLEVAHYKMPWIVWPIMMILGGVAAAIIGSRQARVKLTATHLDRSLAYLWGGFAVFLLTILGCMPWIGFSKTYPIIMLLYALGTFVTGGILQFMPLKIGAIACWLLVIAAFFVPFSLQLILLGASIIVAYLIPGYLLQQKQ